MIVLMLVGTLFLPGFVVAVPNDCRVVETPERYEVVCTGDAVLKGATVPAEAKVLPVQGKHRPLPQQMENERAMRLKSMNNSHLPLADPQTDLVPEHGK